MKMNDNTHLCFCIKEACVKYFYSRIEWYYKHSRGQQKDFQEELAEVERLSKEITKLKTYCMKRITLSNLAMVEQFNPQ